MKHFLTLALSLFISSAAHAYHSETTNNTLYPVCMTVYEWASGETMGKIEDDLHKKNFKGRCRGATLIQPGNSMQAGSGCENFHIVEYRAFFPLVAKNSDLKCDEQAAADKTLITKHIYQAKNADGITRQNLASITHYEAFVDEHYLQGLENHCLSNGEVKKIVFKMAELDSKNKFV